MQVEGGADGTPRTKTEQTGTVTTYTYDGVGQLTNTTGAVVRNYTYDAFGVEDDPDISDTNPFRYCGEYYDRESKTYYLRARYYDPALGRFTQQDTHWNTANMIYGDDPQKINEREDKLGLTTYTMVPQVTAISQSGNLYGYCMNSPVLYRDLSGKDATLAIDTLSALADYYAVLIGGVSTAIASIESAIASSWTFIGAIAGILVGVAAIGVVLYEAAEYLEAAQETVDWVKTQVAAGGIRENDVRDHSVYVITKAGTTDVHYVGRTSNFSARRYAHQLKSDARFPIEDFDMTVVMTGLTLNEARALEQILISAFTIDALDNVINSIAKAKWERFSYEFARMQSLISGLFD